MSGRLLIELWADGARAMRVGGDGFVDFDRPLRVGDDSPAEPEDFVVVAVPGRDCRLERIAVDADSDAQARAAARFMIADRLAAPTDVHVAVGAADELGERWTAAVAQAAMDDWIAQLAAWGIAADVLVPSPLLLPEPADGVVTTVAANGDIDLRAPGEALSADPVLAALVAGDRQTRRMGQAEAAEARMAATELPPLNLLQGSYAVRSPKVLPGRIRRMGLMAFAAGALVLAALLVDGWRHNAAAETARDEIDAIAGEEGITLGDGDPVLATRLALAERGAGAGMSGAAEALFNGLRAAPGMTIESLEWRGGRLVAGLKLPAGVGTDLIRPTVEGAGYQLSGGAVTPTDDGARTIVEIVP